MTKSSRVILILGFLAVAIANPATSVAQCSLTESFNGRFHAPWQLTDSQFVGIRQTVMAVQFDGAAATFHGAVLDPCTYSDFRVSLMFRDLDFTRGKAIAFRTNGAFNGYNINLRSAPFNDVVLSKGPFSSESVATIAPYAHLSGEWVAVEIEAIGAEINVWVNSTHVISYTDPNPVLSGWIFLGINAGGTQSAHAEFDNFTITDINEAVPTESVSWSTLKAQFSDED